MSLTMEEIDSRLEHLMKLKETLKALDYLNTRAMDRVRVDFNSGEIVFKDAGILADLYKLLDSYLQDREKHLLHTLRLF